MRKIIFLALIAGLLLPLGTLYAQTPGNEGAYEELTKDERKKWKKVAKTYRRNPVRLKILSEEHAYFKQQSTQLQNEVAQLEAENSRLSRTNSTLEMQVNDLQAQVQGLEAALRDRPEPQPPLDTDAVVMGVVFKVQIGAYQDPKISDDLVTGENLGTEKEDALQKIIVGQFREYEQAKQLRDQLRAMGVKDAWVVSYRDGVRVPIEEVMPGNRK